MVFMKINIKRFAYTHINLAEYKQNAAAQKSELNKGFIIIFKGTNILKCYLNSVQLIYRTFSHTPNLKFQSKIHEQNAEALPYKPYNV